MVLIGIMIEDRGLAISIAEKNKAKLIIKYISAPKYKFELESKNKKSVDEAIKSIKTELSKFMQSKQGIFTVILHKNMILHNPQILSTYHEYICQNNSSI